MEEEKPGLQVSRKSLSFSMVLWMPHHSHFQTAVQNRNMVPPQRPGAPGTCTGRRSEQSQCVFTELPSTQLKHLLDYMLISFDSVRAEEISLLRGLRLLPPPALPLEHLLSGPVTQGVQYSFPHTRGEDHKRKGRGDRPEAGSREEDGLQQGWQSPKFPPQRMKSWRDKLGIVVQVCNPSY